MRYLLDTNIISETFKPEPSPWLMEWMATQRDENLYIAAFTLAEIRRGVLEKPRGKRRDQLEAWFEGPDGPRAIFSGRILPFEEHSALVWARLMSDGRAAGRPRNALDAIIAAVAIVNQCIVATANERDFAGLDFVNPLKPR